MTAAERTLALFLRVTAAILLLALPAIVLPYAWMDAIHRWLGLGELPDRPMVQYLARSASALYAFLGFVLIFVSRDVRRYLPLVRFLGWAKVIFGVVMLGLDLTVDMPMLWTLVEAPVIVGFGIALLWLARRAMES
jgi:hypothetical protein